MAKRKPKPEGVGPTAERRRHDVIDVVPSLEKHGKAHRVREPLSVDAWLAKGELTPDEHSAAVAFADLHQRVKGSLCSISCYDSDPRYPVEMTSQEAAAELARVYRQLGMIRSRWLDGVLVYGESLRKLERAACVTNGTGLVHFRAAVWKLAQVMGWPMKVDTPGQKGVG